VPLAHVLGARAHARACVCVCTLVCACVCVVFFLIRLSYIYIYVVFCMTFIDWYGFHLHVMYNTFMVEHLIM